MRNLRQNPPFKIGFLLIVITLGVFSVFGQNNQPPDCRIRYAHCRVADYTKIIDSNPADATAYLNRGIANAVEKKTDESIADLTRAAELDPKLAGVYSWRGQMYQRKQNYDRAIADHSRAIALEPATASHYYNRGVVYTDRDNDKAIADYSKAVELAPDEWLYRYVRGWVYYNRGQTLLAEADFKEAKKLEKLEYNQFLVNRVQPIYPSGDREQ